MLLSTVNRKPAAWQRATGPWPHNRNFIHSLGSLTLQQLQLCRAHCVHLFPASSHCITVTVNFVSIQVAHARPYTPRVSSINNSSPLFPSARHCARHTKLTQETPQSSLLPKCRSPCKATGHSGEHGSRETHSRLCFTKPRLKFYHTNLLHL